MDFRKLNRDALLRADQFLAPEGPVPYRRTKWSDAVKAGEAPAPAIRTHRLTAWRWADIEKFLIDLGGGMSEAEDGPEETPETSPRAADLHQAAVESQCATRRATDSGKGGGE